MLNAFKLHWKEYLMEAAGLGLFMISAAFFGTILEYPNSPVHQAISDSFLRRCLMGSAMGLTAIAIIFSPWGKRSGAHLNPAVTLTFFRLGKLDKWDALFYSAFQFAGGLIGVLIMILILGHPFTDSPVLFVATLPGMKGAGLAFIVEAFISCLLMITVLIVSNDLRIAKYTGVFAGALVAGFIIFTAPISGMSINPARSFASAFPAQIWDSFWIYLLSPPLGMLAASEIYLRLEKGRNIICAKLHHHNDKPCIFLNCGYHNQEINNQQTKKIVRQQVYPKNYQQFLMNIHK